MAAEEILKLFDQNWSEKSIFSNHREPSDSPPRAPNPELLQTQEREDGEKLPGSEIPEEKEDEEEQASPPINLLVTRSLSDQNLMSSKTSLLGSPDDLFSPISVLNVKALPPKLQTIVSGKEVNEFSTDNEGLKQEREVDAAEEEKKKKNRKKKKHEGLKTRRKSLSDLEYEEIKGFMDLGFVFSEEDHKDSDLVSILPGLQRLGRKGGDVGEADEEEEEEEEKRGRSGISRPYLSESWDFRGEGKVKKPAAIKWRVPATGNEVDMKDHLKLWAHTVASTIR